MLVPGSSRWRTTMDCKIPSSPDTLWVLLVLCIIMNEGRDHKFPYTNITRFFIVTKGSKWLQVRERERERDKELGLRDGRLLSLILRWRNIKSLTSLLFWWGVLSREPGAASLPSSEHSLTALRIGPNLCTYLLANLLSLYDILDVHAYPSGSQFTWFISAVPLFTQVHILFRNPLLTCRQRSMCNMSLSSFLCTQFNDFKYFYPTRIILLTINHLFAHS